MQNILRKLPTKIKLGNNRPLWNLINRMNLGNFSITIPRKILGLNKFRITCVQIHITQECNLNCRYCYAKNHKGSSLSLETIKNLIQDSKKLGVHEIQFVGGEPFLDHNLKELIALTMANRLRLRIYTNGTQLNEEWLQYLKQYDNMILAIKFDSKTGYKKHIGRDIYSKTVNTIKRAAELRIKTNTFIVVTKKNLHDVRDLTKTSLSLKAVPIVERYLPTSLCKVNNELEINKDEWLNVLKEYEIQNHNNIPKYEYISKLLNCYCSCYQSTLSVDTNGNVIPCPYAPQELSVGNVNDIGLSEIFSNYQKKIMEWNQLPEDCLNCKEVTLCKGGCKTYTYLKCKEFGKKDPLCNGMPPNKTMCAFNHFHKMLN